MICGDLGELVMVIWSYFTGCWTFKHQIIRFLAICVIDVGSVWMYVESGFLEIPFDASMSALLAELHPFLLLSLLYHLVWQFSAWLLWQVLLKLSTLSGS